jgi:hypothetical protein
MTSKRRVQVRLESRGDFRKGQGSGAFKIVDYTSIEVQEINQVKLGGYDSNKRCLYTVDRGKFIYSNEAGTGAH